MAKRKLEIDWLNHGLEFIVVIIGILLAFQLDKCSSDNQQEKTVNNHLQQILEETELNRNALETTLLQAEGNLAKLNTMFYLLNEGEDYERINRLSFELLNMEEAYFRKHSFHNLTESGDIRFVKEFEVKRSIISLYEYYKWVESVDDISRSMYLQDYYPYVKNNFDLISSRVQDREVYQSKLFKNVLAAYITSTEDRITKYRDCLLEIDQYLKSDNRNSR